MLAQRIDPTTGFLDRYSCLQMASDLVNQLRQAGRPLAAIWIDLDRFRQINESWGHQNGDNVIANIAQRLREGLHGRAAIGRVGADEFVCLAPDCTRPHAEQLASELMEVIEKPLEFGEIHLRPTVSVGIALLGAADATYTFLERADRAKMTAKKQGGHRYVVSEDELQAGRAGVLLAREELELEFALHEALETGSLQMVYQPTVGMDGSILSVEALMRCCARKKAIPPSTFIPVAEKTGLIVRLGEWSLLEGTRQARALVNAGLPTRVAINVSRAQMLDEAFPQALNAALLCANVSPALIELELTETLFMDMSPTVQANLRAAQDAGISFAIDDFGIGYSSLANLKDITASKLKLDRAFVHSLPHDKRSLAVVRAIVQLGRDLGMKVVVEGVEQAEQAEVLRDLGVDGIQGYHYAHPMEANALISWLKDANQNDFGTRQK